MRSRFPAISSSGALFDQKGEGMPEARRRLIERLGFAGRL